MLTCPVYCADPSADDLAQRVAAALDQSVARALPTAAAYLVCTAEGLSLQIQLAQTTRYQVDFLSPQMCYRQRHAGKQQLIARACRVNKTKTVLDLTAGFGRDGFILASLGLSVRMVEVNPIIAALLQDGLARLKATEASIDVTALQADAATYLAGTIDPAPDVIYFDPMFAHSNTALVKKELQIIQSLTSNAATDPQLLEVARQLAQDRVVVKRQRYAEYWGTVKPDQQLTGRKIRYDIYLASK
jgi:16S rRNA (guanine1516-N2)-methyltransferase